MDYWYLVGNISKKQSIGTMKKFVVFLRYFLKYSQFPTY